MKRRKWAGWLVVTVLAPLTAMAQARVDQAKFRELCKERVETDTSITTGSCTRLADGIEKHLRESGFTGAQITRFAVPDHPKEGGLVAMLPGTQPSLKARRGVARARSS